MSTQKRVECFWTEEKEFSCTLCNWDHVAVNIVFKKDKYYCIHNACAQVGPGTSWESIRVILTEPVPAELVIKASADAHEFGVTTFFSTEFSLSKNEPKTINNLFITSATWPAVHAALQALGPYVKETQKWGDSYGHG